MEITEENFIIAFGFNKESIPLSEITELKKASRGIKGIALDKGDELVYGCVVDAKTETFSYNQKVYSAKKVKMRKRGAKGMKSSL